MAIGVGDLTVCKEVNKSFKIFRMEQIAAQPRWTHRQCCKTGNLVHVGSFRPSNLRSNFVLRDHFHSNSRAPGPTRRSWETHLLICGFPIGVRITALVDWPDWRFQDSPPFYQRWICLLFFFWAEHIPSIDFRKPNRKAQK